MTRLLAPEAGAVVDCAAVQPLLVIGAGRSSLAFVSRLPAAALPGVLVVDAHGAWLGAWAARLAGCGATHVRAPHTATPFPSPLALQAFAHAGRRTDELATSSPRFVAVPTLALYADFCAHQLPRTPAAAVPVRKAVVTSLSAVTEEERARLRLPAGGLRVHFADGGSLVAAQVVYAAAHRTVNVPTALAPLLAAAAAGAPGAPPRSKLALSADVAVRDCAVRGQSVVVVGGGMTSASLALAALEAGAAQVTLVCRRALRKRELDVGPEWAGAKALREFNACTEAVERLGAARRARGGASLNALAWASLRFALRAHPARLDIRERAQLETAQWDGAQFHIRLKCDASGAAATAAKAAHAAPASAADGDAEAEADMLVADVASAAAAADVALVADVIWVACGAAPDASNDPVLTCLLRGEAPARVLGGYPVLEAGVRWPGAPLFVLGAYATLTLGPAAALPSGHRAGAEACIASVAACAAAVAAGELPYDAAAGALPLDVLYDDGDLSHPHAALPGDDATSAAATSASQLRKLPGGALIDVSDLEASLPRRNLESYAWSDSAAEENESAGGLNGFTLEVSVEIPEAVTHACCRVAFTEDAAELWAVCAGGAYRLHLPALYRRICPQRCSLRVAPRARRVTLVMRKRDSTPWRFLKAA